MPSSTRQKGVIISHPIIYGSVAFYQGKKVDAKKSYKWHIYLRGIENENLSNIIKKVEIRLHESFEKPIRVLTEPPFHVSEYGWGEFDIQMKIYFQDEQETPIELTHTLRLFSPIIASSGISSTNLIATKKPVIHENYDEFVFNEPTEFFMNKLIGNKRGRGRISNSQKEINRKQNLDFLTNFPEYSEVIDLDILTQKNEIIEAELEKYKERLIQAENKCKKYRTE